MRRKYCEAAENVDIVRSGEVEVGKKRHHDQGQDSLQLYIEFYLVTLLGKH